MLFSRDYQKPFWRGLFHALTVVFYSFFIALVSLSLEPLFNGEIGAVVRAVVWTFLAFLSIAVSGYLIFYEPMKTLVRQHFKAASVMIASTFGWLFVFLIIFLLGLVLTMPEFG